MWHPTLGTVRYSVSGMSHDPDQQVQQTLGLMGARVAEDSSDPQFVSRVRHAFDVKMYPGMRGTGAGRGVIPWSEDEIDLCNQVWAHTKSGIRFQRDEVTGDGVGGYPQDEVVETIIRPREMANFMDAGTAVGDCDDFSMYVAACLKALGIPCAFATTAADARDPGQFSHVYVVAYPRSGNGMRMRMPIDASHGEYPGWETPGLGRYQEWPVLDKASWLVGSFIANAAVVIGIVAAVRYLGRIA